VCRVGSFRRVYPYRIMTSENALENEIATRNGTQSDCGIRGLLAQESVSFLGTSIREILSTSMGAYQVLRSVRSAQVSRRNPLRNQ